MKFTDLLNELFYVGALPDKERLIYYLIQRYEDKVSNKLLKKKEELYKQGKALHSEMIRELVGKPNPFLELIKKDKSAGAAYHQPVIIPFDQGQN